MNTFFEEGSSFSPGGERLGTVLVVDDVPANLNILIEYLTRGGFKILVAESGQSAIERADRMQPDIILLDVMMPHLDGFETCRMLKEQESTRDIPVIFMTVLADIESKVRGFEVGAVDYITKPIEYREVLMRLNTHLALRKLQRSVEEKNLLLEQEIAERRQAEEALHESEEIAQALLNAPVDCVILLDADGGILALNSAGAQLLGHASPDEWTEQPFYELLPPVLSAQFRANNKRVLQSGQPLRFEGQHKEKWLDHVIYPILGEAGQVKKLVIVARDISEHKNMEGSLRRYGKRLQALHGIDRDILATRSPEAIAQAAVGHLCELIACPTASVMEFETDSEQLRAITVDTRDDSPLKPGEETISPAALNMEKLQQGQMCIINDLDTAEEPLTPFEQSLYRRGIRAYINVPLIVHKELVGILSIGAERSQFFSANALDIAEEIAASLAIALQQARLYEQTQQDARERELLLKAVNHRVSNNLSAIIGMLNLAKGQVTETVDCQTYESIMQGLANRVKGLATVHRMLSDSDWAPLPLDNLIWQVTYSSLQALPYQKRLAVDVTPCQARVTSKQANYLALVVNELATNSVKYALPNRQQGQFVVTIEQDDGLVRLVFQDDGPGYPTEVLEGQNRGLGLELVQDIMRQQLQGQLSLESEAGAITRLSFKLHEPASFALWDGGEQPHSA